MKLSLCLAAATLSGIVSGWPSMNEHVKKQPRLEGREVDRHPWKPAHQIPGAVRAPCPGSNTLANHGFINRDGKRITKAAYQKGFLDAFGMGLGSTASGAQNAINLCSHLTGRQCKSFDLNMLSHPHVIEHDASLTRNDFNMSWSPHKPWNNHSFNMTIFQKTLSWYGALTHVNLNHANSARLGRQRQARIADTPGWFRANNAGSSFEAAFYLSVTNDPALKQNYSNNPQARLSWIKYWFENERLPTAIGWRRPRAPLTCMACLAAKVSAAHTVPPAKVKRGLNDANPTVASALSQASKVVGPAPSIPNFYAEVISPSQMAAVEAQQSDYEKRLSAAVTAALAGPPRH